MKNTIIASALISLFLITTSCQNRPNETAWGLGMGSVLGGATYMATKSKNKYTAPLTFIALVGGSMIGKSLGGAIDDINELKFNKALNENPDYTKSEWVDPNTKASIEVQPTATFKEVIPQINKEDESWCRKVDWKISHNGQSSFGETTVCRNMLTGEWEAIIPMSSM